MAQSTLLGRTGAKKSTLSALALSFFGSFTETELPMSFADTPNSILYNASHLDDVLTCVDDSHPYRIRKQREEKQGE